MHRTLGDGYIEESGKRIYADEDLGSGRDATQLRHEEINSFQEEICSVIESEGYTLNSPSEAISTMNQLNTAINNKLKSSRIENLSSVSGSNVSDALNNLLSTNTTQDTNIAANSSLIGSIQSDIGTVTGSDLQTQVNQNASDIASNDTDIAALQVLISNLDATSSLKGDTLIFDTSDNQYKPSNLRAFRSRIQVDTMNDGRASSSGIGGGLNNITDIVGITVSLYSQSNHPTDPDYFTVNAIHSSQVHDWNLTAVFRGHTTFIYGNIEVTLPVNVLDYNSAINTVYQGLLLEYSTSPGYSLWYGPTSEIDHENCGRGLAVGKAVNTGANLNYRSALGEWHITYNYIALPETYNKIWIGGPLTWFTRKTEANCSDMPGIFDAGRKHGISFSLQVPSAQSINYP